MAPAMERYRIIDHTADIGLEIYGKTREEVFINAASGLFSLITNPDRVAADQQQKIGLDAPDYDELLVAWLNELLYYFDAEGLLFSRFEIERLTRERLVGRAYGEKLDRSRHEINTVIKAATYHQLKLEATDEGFQARIILDI